ncbi:cupin domain-containing protein [Bacillales bacterium AN1005]
MTDLEVFSDLSERLDYNLPDLPLYVRKGSLYQFNNHAAVAHWHVDLEFIYVLKGSMDFSVNGSITRLHQGDGLFVNSQRLHYGYAIPDHDDCSFLVVVIHPSILGEKASYIQTYWEEKFSSKMADFVVLTDQVGWQQDILRSDSGTLSGNAHGAYARQSTAFGSSSVIVMRYNWRSVKARFRSTWRINACSGNDSFHSSEL